jgi:Tol biopolymer transport system component
MTRLVVAVLVAGLTIVVPSAAQVGSGKIAFVTGSEIYAINPDGTGRTVLQRADAGYNRGLVSARWSPDGSRLAFVDRRGETDWRLMVMNADGSNEHLVAAARSIGLGGQPWSPDSSRIAWGQSSSLSCGADLYTADASGGDVRRLTFHGLARSSPSWSPTGSTLVYTRDCTLEEVFVIGADGQGERRITPGFHPTWSPSGEWIAFIGGGGVSLVRPDGSDLRTVAVGGNSSPTWSPDGSRIAFNVVRSGGRTDVLSDLYVVDASGSNLKRLNPPDGNAGAPTWSPEGGRILFGSWSYRAGFRGGFVIANANADGKCQVNLTRERAYDIPSWQRIPNGPPTDRTRCHAIAATASDAWETPTAAVIGLAVVNEGTQPVTKVTLDVPTPDGVSPAIAASRGRGCTIRRGNTKCRLSRLDPGDRHVFSVRFQARRVRPTGRIVRFRAHITADASERLLLSGREKTSVRFVLSQCADRDRGGGTIRGRPSADRICGRRGADRIYPGPGSDVVKAGGGNDVILTADGRRYRDQISCGRGRDRVKADRGDRISHNCEHVTRR